MNKITISQHNFLSFFFPSVAIAIATTFAWIMRIGQEEGKRSISAGINQRRNNIAKFAEANLLDCHYCAVPLKDKTLN